MRASYILWTVLMLSCASGDHTAAEQTNLQEQSTPYSELHANGQPYIQGQLLNGQRHGLWISYYENGVKWSEDEYYKGERNGNTVSYYPSGMYRYRGTYIDDKPAGTWTFYQEDGSIEKKIDYNEK